MPDLQVTGTTGTDPAMIRVLKDTLRGWYNDCPFLDLNYDRAEDPDGIDSPTHVVTPADTDPDERPRLVLWAHGLQESDLRDGRLLQMLADVSGLVMVRWASPFLVVNGATRHFTHASAYTNMHTPRSNPMGYRSWPNPNATPGLHPVANAAKLAAEAARRRTFTERLAAARLNVLQLGQPYEPGVPEYQYCRQVLGFYDSVQEQFPATMRQSLSAS